MDHTAALLACIPRLRRYARALLGHGADADDLVQDCLERAWSRRELYRPGSDLRAWLFTVMHNLFVNRYRANRRRAATVTLEADTLVAPESAESAHTVNDIERALQELPPAQREVLLLVALEQLSYDEVAAALDIPRGTVMSRLHRAREKLRTLLPQEVV